MSVAMHWHWAVQLQGYTAFLCQCQFSIVGDICCVWCTLFSTESKSEDEYAQINFHFETKWIREYLQYKSQKPTFETIILSFHVTEHNKMNHWIKCHKMPREPHVMATFQFHRALRGIARKKTNPPPKKKNPEKCNCSLVWSELSDWFWVPTRFWNRVEGEPLPLLC